jgi:extradiol dioxygenase family protein
MTTRPAVHLAVPVDDLDAARRFYGGVLGLREGRSTGHWVDWDLHGHQLVTHVVAGGPAAAGTSSVDRHAVPVPHFGLLLSTGEFHELADRLRAAGTEFVIEPYRRFPGEPAEQWTMFLYDPAGNALEFKAFLDESKIFTL